jgi:heptosyltransferase-2
MRIITFIALTVGPNSFYKKKAMAANAPSILIVAPSWVGDTMMAQSLFKLLKAQGPVNIDVLATQWVIDLLKCMPEVRETILMPLEHGDLKIKKRYALGYSLREKQYDQAIILPNTFKSAIVPWAAGIPKRTGWMGEFRFALLNEIRFLNRKRYPRMVERYLALGLPKGAAIPPDYPRPKLTVDQKKAEDTAKLFNVQDRPKRILALCPGAAYGSAKCWPSDHFAALAKQKHQEGYDIWLFGAKQDAATLDPIATALNHECQHFGGKLTLKQTIQLLSFTTCVVSNDSGLMHVAAALDKPVFAIFGPTNPAFTPPLSDKAVILTLKLPCQPCGERTCPLKHNHCMTMLTTEQVLDAMKKAGY